MKKPLIYLANIKSQKTPRNYIDKIWRKCGMKKLYPIYKNKRLLLVDILSVNICVLLHGVLKPVFGILAFVITMFLIMNTIFMMAMYTNKSLNLFWKSKDTLDIFIQVNKTYMATLFLLLALILLLHTLVINCEFSGSISLLTTYIVLTRSWMMIYHYLDTYKNTYSERILNEK